MKTKNTIVISAQNALVPELKPAKTETQFNTTDFDTREVLGKKGTRSMDKLTGLAIHCIAGLIPALQEQRDHASDRIGMVLGSAQGSMDSIVRFTYETLAYDRADYVNPALFPNTVMNCAAGQSAIWHGLKGPNATISGGELSSFAAINYAISLLDKGYADTLIAGGAEELTEANMAANRVFAEEIGVVTKFSEACAFFVVETEEVASRFNRKVIGEIAAIKTGFNPNFTKCDALVSLIKKVLDSAGISPTEVAEISSASAWPQTREVELTAIKQAFKDASIMPPVSEAFKIYGNAVSAQNALQMSAVLASLDNGEYGLLLAQDLKGNTGAMLIKGRKA